LSPVHTHRVIDTRDVRAYSVQPLASDCSNKAVKAPIVAPGTMVTINCECKCAVAYILTGWCGLAHIAMLLDEQRWLRVRSRPNTIRACERSASRFRVAARR